MVRFIYEARYSCTHPCCQSAAYISGFPKWVLLPRLLLLPLLLPHFYRCSCRYFSRLLLPLLLSPLLPLLLPLLLSLPLPAASTAASPFASTTRRCFGQCPFHYICGFSKCPWSCILATDCPCPCVPSPTSTTATDHGNAVIHHHRRHSAWSPVNPRRSAPASSGLLTAGPGPRLLLLPPPR